VKVFAVSDLHVDFEPNAAWVANLSRHEFTDDIIIVAGDVSDDLRLVEGCLGALAKRFAKVMFVPGNHDLWVVRDGDEAGSIAKLEKLRNVAEQCGVSTSPQVVGRLAIVPLLSWYDYSFGEPSEELLSAWADFVACRWPAGTGVGQVTDHFLAKNPRSRPDCRQLITFSHFLPRLELVPRDPRRGAIDLRPVMGAARLDTQLRALGSEIHVYGHSHVSRVINIDGVTYVNNALGYPRERAFGARQLKCVHES
jgi:predicted phosphodiesterase